MPQHQLIPDRPGLVGLRLTIVDRQPEGDPTWQFLLEQRARHGDWATLRADVWQGIMLDFATTWAADLTAAFLYGEGGEDLFRTGRSLHKAAREHVKAHGAGF